ncbi:MULTISPECIES: nitrogen fixation protein NifZ [unclassified Lebetimonas]|jgi:nitrogen fixation protein NifZ|uniref:nitrogen fixation protein NifZ n=1 Tax=unclassified Lebetimonas TaxID=2648158 RepID=UPI0004650704|nr:MULTISPECIES: nitrogen fixation protein NifZ [unclassified Lebetimonas]
MKKLTVAEEGLISSSTKDEILPKFKIGQRVRIKVPIKNDGTNPFYERNAILIEPGEEGYVKHIGDFLQVIRIYEVHFLEKGVIFGCREDELEAVEDDDFYDEVEEELKWIREHRAKKEKKQIQSKST